MLLGYNTNGFAEHRLSDAINILSKLGYQSVAITLNYHALDPMSSDLAREVAEIRTQLKSCGMRSVIETGGRFLLDPHHKHQPTLVTPAPAERKRRLDFLCGAINIAGELVSDCVSFWSGIPTEEPRDVQLERLREECLRLCDHAESRQVRLAFEPEPGMLIERMEQYAELASVIDRHVFGLTLDVGHVHCLGDGDSAQHISRFRERLWNVHIEDMRHGRHEHLMFGEGDMKFAPIFSALKEIRYSGAVHVELSRHSHNAVNAATQAMAFLRRELGQPSTHTE
jgi:sugar phosphate isomerase/epimerase